MKIVPNLERKKFITWTKQYKQTLDSTQKRRETNSKYIRKIKHIPIHLITNFEKKNYDKSKYSI